MQWLDIDLFVFLRFIGLLGVLFLFYCLLFDRKASFRHCRFYLLGIVFISMLISVVQFPIRNPFVKPDVVRSEVIIIARGDGNEMAEKPESDVFVSEQEEVVVSEKEYAITEGIPNVVVPSVLSYEDRIKGVLDKLQNWNFWWIGYGVVVLFLFFRFLREVVSIMRLKREGVSQKWENYTLIRNKAVGSPFSFGNSIFINDHLTGEALRVILLHEKNHIVHKHYIDSWFINIVSILFWFNPFIWFVRRELIILHEYQADHDVLTGGVELGSYQGIIFSELMGYGPEIASGFHNSLIKKRFLMMKNGNCIKHRLLRKLLVVPVLGGVCALFAFTLAEPQNDGGKPEETDEIAGYVVDQRGTLVGDDEKDKKKSEQDVFQGMTEKQKEIYKRYYIPNGKEPEKELQHVTLREDQIVESNVPFSCSRFQLKHIERDVHETRVTRVEAISWDRQWIQFRKGYCMVDLATGKEYRLRGVARGIELNKVLWVHEKNGKMIEFTMIFDPLDPGVKKVDFVNKYPEEGGAYPPNSVSRDDWANIEVDEYAPAKNEVVFNYLLDEQCPEIGMDKGGRDYKLLSFLREGNETKVTFAVEILRDQQPICFSKGWVIRDCLSKKKYYINRVERNIPLDRVSMVRGKKGKFITFTMVFPYVPMDVKFVDIMQVPEKKQIAQPVNMPVVCWYDVFVENNRFPYNTPNTISDNRMTHPQDLLMTKIEKKGKADMELKIYNKGITELSIRIPVGGKYRIPSTFALQDCASGKAFVVKGLQGDYKLDQDYKLKKGTLLTLNFENLPYGIDQINIGVGNDNASLSCESVAINN